MTEHRFGSVTVELTIGDISAQHDFDAVVNAANAELRIGGGVVVRVLEEIAREQVDDTGR